MPRNVGKASPKKIEFDDDCGVMVRPLNWRAGSRVANLLRDPKTGEIGETVDPRQDWVLMRESIIGFWGFEQDDRKLVPLNTVQRLAWISPPRDNPDSMEHFDDLDWVLNALTPREVKRIEEVAFGHLVSSKVATKNSKATSGTSRPGPRLAGKR